MDNHLGVKISNSPFDDPLLRLWELFQLVKYSFMLLSGIIDAIFSDPQQTFFLETQPGKYLSSLRTFTSESVNKRGVGSVEIAITACQYANHSVIWAL